MTHRLLWSELAALAFTTARAGRYPEAATCALALVTQCTRDDLVQALDSWVTASLSAAYGDLPPGTVSLSFTQGSGPQPELVGTDTVPPPIRWAGQYIAARLAADPDTAQALVDSVPEDNGLLANTLAVLKLCAQQRLLVLVAPTPPGGADARS